MSEFGPAEKVYVELEWYDGPCAGVASVNGVPHRFAALFDETEGEYSDTFRLWPLTAEMLALEREQWRIFVAWNELYESGAATHESHPGSGGRHARWDEIDGLAKEDRKPPSAHGRLARARFVSLQGKKRFESCGPNYEVRWQLL